MSLYHGDFESIGHELAVHTEGFKDFTLLANIPYGHQSATYQRHTVRDTQNLYRRLGRFLNMYASPPQTNLNKADKLIGSGTSDGGNLRLPEEGGSAGESMLSSAVTTH